MDPLRTDMRPAEALSGIERDARIEQLLLAGLDEYFAHRYERAINLWTRVLFLDRHHDRARAYIDRARRAQAEIQRESEAILHQAIERLRDGDVHHARHLVADALDRGASHDDVQVVLERIERLGQAQTAPPVRRALAATRSSGDRELPASADPATADAPGSAALLLSAAAVGVLAVAAWGLMVPLLTALDAPSGAAAPGARAAAEAFRPLPTVGAAEIHVAKARAQVAAGRLRDALATLDHVQLGDSLRPEADRLRADVQRWLLAAERPPE